LGKKRSIIAIARILAETIYTMLKNNVKYIEKERKETINPDELYFKRLEELSLRKINNMRRIANNANVHDDSANLIYRGGIKDC
jgi:transposase